MPAYNSPALPPQLLQKGVPAYLFGGLNMLRGDALGYVQKTAITTNVATITVTITTGPTPLVGDLITVWATAQQAGIFNVTRAIITAVSITATTGAGTISYALTGSNQSATADAGAFRCEVGETSETLAAGASQPVQVQAPEGDSQFTVVTAVTFPTLPTAATVVLQEAIRDVNGEYTTLGNAAVVAASNQTTGPVAQFTLTRGNYYRFLVSGITGSGTIVAKVL